MTPVAELLGKWVVTVDGEVVAHGDSAVDVVTEAIAKGYDEDDLLVERVSEPGSYIL